ncbi:hypothetical protein [Shewanella marisflavi]|uniref:Uncharacterized protein n=2 Tax=Shewanella TaxID=22 RepID=A0ABX5WP33_9GAMM|nr:hypothetical protein [Shewanella marisflavi]QDF76328.1 hypothetical protein FGA12_14850 [Shewanella marisflavi]
MKRVISVAFNDVANKHVNFEDLGTLYSFAKAQSKFWSEAAEKYKNANNHSLINSANYFNQLINLIDSWKESIETWDDTQLNQQFNNNRNIFNNIRQNWLWSGHPFLGNPQIIPCTIN